MGVDVEPVDRRAPLDIADRYFAPDERAWLFARPEAERPRGFFRLWTMKEAFIKATGKGISQGLQSFAIGFDPLGVSFPDPAREEPGPWRLAEAAIGEGSHGPRLARAEGRGGRGEAGAPGWDIRLTLGRPAGPAARGAKPAFGSPIGPRAVPPGRRRPLAGEPGRLYLGAMDTDPHGRPEAGRRKTYHHGNLREALVEAARLLIEERSARFDDAGGGPRGRGAARRALPHFGGRPRAVEAGGAFQAYALRERTGARTGRRARPLRAFTAAGKRASLDFAPLESRL